MAGESAKVIENEGVETTEIDFMSMPLDQLEIFDPDAVLELKTEPVVDPVKVEPIVTEPEYIPPVKEDWESTKKQVEEKEKFIQRQSNEIGELRKIKAEVEQFKKVVPPDDVAELDRLREIDDKVEFNQEWKKYETRKENEQIQRQNLEFMNKIHKNREATLEFVPDFTDTTEEMIALLKEDGARAEDIEGFKTNPFVLEPATLFNLRKRADLVKVNQGLNSEVGTLKSTLEQLQKENDALKKRPGEMLRNIESASKSRQMTNTTGGANEKIEEGDISQDPFSVPLDKLRVITGRN